MSQMILSASLYSWCFWPFPIQYLPAVGANLKHLVANLAKYSNTRPPVSNEPKSKGCRLDCMFPCKSVTWCSGKSKHSLSFVANIIFHATVSSTPSSSCNSRPASLIQSIITIYLPPSCMPLASESTLTKALSTMLALLFMIRTELLCQYDHQSHEFSATTSSFFSCSLQQLLSLYKPWQLQKHALLGINS